MSIVPSLGARQSTDQHHGPRSALKNHSYDKRPISGLQKDPTFKTEHSVQETHVKFPESLPNAKVDQDSVPPPHVKEVDTAACEDKGKDNSVESGQVGTTGAEILSVGNRAASKNRIPLTNSAKLPFPIGSFTAAFETGSARGFVSGASATILEDASRPSKPQSTENKHDRKGQDVTTHDVKDNFDSVPWHGNHLEDELTEKNIKNGFAFIKPVGDNEYASAKPTLLPHLKNRSGLKTLSALFATVFREQQETGRITAGSTFKLPPRLTLTDTKREAWLRDLANVNIPLRRFSRTIPHGIRGQILLEKCLERSIPIKRAVWLAQCVGANEVRAFKRKGISGAITMGNELKWVKDWTTVVESFVEDCFSASEEANWKSKVNYTLQLAFSLYSESLLDRDHFMQWQLQFFETCEIDKIPIATLLIQMSWRELIATFKNAQRLASACIKRITQTSTSVDSDIFAPLTAKLSEILESLLLSQPQSILVAHDVKSLQASIRLVQKTSNHKVIDVSQLVLDRSNRLVKVIDKQMVDMGTISKVVTILHSLKPESDITEDTAQLLAISPNIDELAIILLQWASSVYWTSPERTFLVTRILKELSRKHALSDLSIVKALEKLDLAYGIDPETVTRVLSDLVRIQEFDVGQYLRWLIATGALNGINGRSIRELCHLRLLVDMPLANLPENMINLRKTLLRTLHINVSSETMVICQAQHQLAQILPHILFPSREGSNASEPVSISGLSLTETLAITNWIRQSLKSFLEVGKNLKPRAETKQSRNILSQHDYLLIRELLEKFHDYRSLAGVLRVVIPYSDMNLLYLLADTVSQKFSVFTAMGATRMLFSFLFERYRQLRTDQPPAKEIAQSLDALATRTNADRQLILLLKRDVVGLDQPSGVAAFTPASESILDSNQIIGPDIDDDVEKIFSSGNYMDSQSFSRIFNVLTARIEKGYDHLAHSCHLLARLGTYDEDLFDAHLRDWMISIVSSKKSLVFSDVARTLIGENCCSFESIISWAATYIRKTGKQGSLDEADQTLILHVLDFIADDCALDSNNRTFRFAKEHESFLKDNPEQLLQWLRWALELPSSNGLSLGHLGKILDNQICLPVLRRLLVQKPIEFQTWIDKQAQEADIERIAKMNLFVQRLVDPGGTLGLSDAPLAQLVQRLFEIVDEFSLPFFKLALHHLTLLVVNAEEADATKLAVFNSVQAAAKRDNLVWIDLISCLSPNIVQRIDDHFSRTILSKSPALIFDDLSGISEKKYTMYSTILNTTAFAIPSTGQGDTAVSIVDHLNSLLPFLHHDSLTLTPSTISRSVQYHIQLVLRLAVIHKPSFSSAGNVNDLLHVLCKYIASTTTRLPPHLLQFVFDIAAYFILDSPNDHLAIIWRSLGPLAHNSAIRFLLGVRESPEARLFLQQRIPASTSQSSQANSVPTATASMAPFMPRPWELLPDSTPNVGINDTALSLRLFDARRVL